MRKEHPHTLPTPSGSQEQGHYGRGRGATRAIGRPPHAAFRLGSPGSLRTSHGDGRARPREEQGGIFEAKHAKQPTMQYNCRGEKGKGDNHAVYGCLSTAGARRDARVQHAPPQSPGGRLHRSSLSQRQQAALRRPRGSGPGCRRRSYFPSPPLRDDTHREEGRSQRPACERASARRQHMHSSPEAGGSTSGGGQTRLACCSQRSSAVWTLSTGWTEMTGGVACPESPGRRGAA
jgi:hypothetical protein